MGNARDLVSLKQSLRQSLTIKQLLQTNSNSLMNLIAKTIIDTNQQVIDIINQKIVDDPPVDIKKGRMIKSGVHEELDRLRDISNGGKEWIEKLEKTRTD